ncbi:MAG: hypothetical protein J1E81_06130 [Eubacterium sp.]|nr:hypothetical protein [Eubacterium sp.]
MLQIEGVIMGVTQAWTSPWGWIAVGDVNSDGSMVHAHVSDADGLLREYDYYFKSKQEFLDYVDRINKEIMKKFNN